MRCTHFGSILDRVVSSLPAVTFDASVVLPVDQLQLVDSQHDTATCVKFTYRSQGCVERDAVICLVCLSVSLNDAHGRLFADGNLNTSMGSSRLIMWHCGTARSDSGHGASCQYNDLIFPLNGNKWRVIFSWRFHCCGRRVRWNLAAQRFILQECERGWNYCLATLCK